MRPTAGVMMRRRERGASRFILFLIANIVPSSKALVTNEAMHLFLIASCYYYGTLRQLRGQQVAKRGRSSSPVRGVLCS